jgi:hypothetical protein
MTNNHTTDTEAEASAAVEIQMMEEVSNSNNTNTKRLGIPSFSMFNFNGLIVFAVMTVTTFIVIAVFVSLNAADRAMMMASQQKAPYSKATKAPKASKAPTGANVCSWPLKTKLCSGNENVATDTIEFDVCPTVEAEGEDVGKFSFQGLTDDTPPKPVVIKGKIEMDAGGFVDFDEFSGQFLPFTLGSLSVRVSAGVVEIETLSDGVGTFSAANCPP